MTKSKTKTEISQEESVIDATLVEKLDAWRSEEIQRENSHTIVDLIQYLSDNVYPDYKNKDANAEIKNVRKYILASYPFDESLGISRNAYDVMNSRISRGGQLVYRNKITIEDNRLRDKKGNAITISKMEDIHNNFINKTSKPKLEAVKEEIQVEESVEDTPPTVEQSSRKLENELSHSDIINELSNTDLFVDVSTTFFTKMMSLNSSDLDNLFNDRNFVEYVHENYKPLKHLLEKIISIGTKKKSKVA